MPPSCPPALLALANGAVFYGDSVGASGSTVGEVVFNTALTGYQEILTDPSYVRQIVTLTAPHIGNTGVNEEDIESSHIQAAGLVVREDRKSTRLNSSHQIISYAVFCLKKKKK